jgi:hypothetical protein
VKFSVINICSLITSSRAAVSRSSWESAAMGLEYLFMGLFINDARGHQEQIAEDNHNYADDRIRISVLNQEGKPSIQKREVQG